MIFGLNSKQLVDQNIPVIGYTSLPSSWELLVSWNHSLGVLRYLSWTAASASAVSPQIADDQWQMSLK